MQPFRRTNANPKILHALRAKFRPIPFRRAPARRPAHAREIFIASLFICGFKKALSAALREEKLKLFDVDFSVNYPCAFRLYLEFPFAGEVVVEMVYMLSV